MQNKSDLFLHKHQNSEAPPLTERKEKKQHKRLWRLFALCMLLITVAGFPAQLWAQYTGGHFEQGQFTITAATDEYIEFRIPYRYKEGGNNINERAFRVYSGYLKFTTDGGNWHNLLNVAYISDLYGWSVGLTRSYADTPIKAVYSNTPGDVALDYNSRRDLSYPRADANRAYIVVRWYYASDPSLRNKVLGFTFQAQIAEAIDWNIPFRSDEHNDNYANVTLTASPFINQNPLHQPVIGTISYTPEGRVVVPFSVPNYNSYDNEGTGGDKFLFNGNSIKQGYFFLESQKTNTYYSSSNRNAYINNISNLGTNLLAKPASNGSFTTSKRNRDVFENGDVFRVSSFRTDRYTAGYDYWSYGSDGSTYGHFVKSSVEKALPVYPQSQNFSVAPDVDGKLKISWKMKQGAAGSPADGFEIQWRAAGASAWSSSLSGVPDYDPTQEQYSMLANYPEMQKGTKTYEYRIRRTGLNWGVFDDGQTSVQLNTSYMQLTGVTVSIIDGKAVLAWETGAGSTEDNWSYSVKRSDVPNNIVEGTAIGTKTIEDAGIPNCTPVKYTVEIRNGSNILIHSITSSTIMKVDAVTGSISKFSVSKGFYNDRVRLVWNITDDANFDYYTITRKERQGTGVAEQIYEIQKTGNTVYRYDDNTAVPGIYYDYMVNAYSKCDVVSNIVAQIQSIGFTQPYGIVSGRVSFDGNTAVEGVSLSITGGDNLTNKSMEMALAQKTYVETSPYKEGTVSPQEFSFQAWVKLSSGTANIGLFTAVNRYEVHLNNGGDGGVRLRANYKNIYKHYNLNNAKFNKGEYQHLTVTYKADTIPASNYVNVQIKAYIDGVLVDSVTSNDQVEKTNFGFTPYTESDKLFFGRGDNNDSHFDGYMDEVRLWTKVLSAEEVKNNFDRYITGKESNLSLYYRFDEVDGYEVFDISGQNNNFNENHGKVQGANNSIRSTTNVPSSAQLSIKATTDRTGKYLINTIPYTGDGNQYTLIPSLGVHQFSPSEEALYVSASSATHNNINFTDISSFEVSGTVTYEGGTYPVEGCSFEIDDRPVTLADGSLVKSGYEGTFTVSVPIGVHKVRVVKQGHVFADNGLLLDNGADINYNQNLSGLKFFDRTRVKLIGRVTGGLAENDKPLGFGESKNNIGAQTIQLESTRPEYWFTDSAVELSFGHNEGQWSKPDGLSDDSTTVKYEENQITINVSPVTGEFAAWVYPEPYNIADIKVPGANSTQLTIYSNNEMIDLSSAAVPDDSYMKTSVRTWQDSVFVSKPGMVDHYEPVELSDTVRYHAEWKYYYQATPTFSVHQVEAGEPAAYLGERSIIIRDALTTQSDTLDLWNGTSYLFGDPLFQQGKEYKFLLQAYEQYVNYAASPADTVTYPVTEGIVDMTNNIRLNPSPEQIELDADGKAVYSFTAGAPDLTTAKNNVFATVKIGVVSYYWDKGQNPVEAWHLGDKSTGTDFMTSGPDELTAILRDPPGSNSHAYIESGSTITTSVKNSIVNGITEAMNLTTSLGTKITTFVGLGAGVITEAETKLDISGGLKSEQTWNKETEKSTTTTFTERFETSSDPLYVGHLGDVFIGNSTNIQYGLTNSIQIRKSAQEDTDVVFASATLGDKNYMIVPAVGLAYGQTFATRFAFTQVELEEIMIPKWEQSIALKLQPAGTAAPNTATITEPVYVSKLAESNENFGKMNIDTVAFPGADMTKPYDGASYKIYFPAGWGTTEMKEFQDSIIWANNQINTWVSVLEQNEKEKVEMTHLGNYSFGAGASIGQSKTTTVSSSSSKTFTWVLNPTLGGQTGGDIMGIGLNLKIDLEYKHENTETTSETKESTMTVGFVLQEEGDDDQITVDYGSTASGTMAFKSRGGRTSCPYEGEVRSQYYEPGSHILSEATMQIEVPKIDVSSSSSVLNVPANKTASFVLDLKNESETGEDVWFQLIVDEVTNPDGADLKIDGGIIGNGRMFLVRAGEVLQKTLTVGKGTADTYNNIGLILRSQCQHDPTDFLPDIADTTFISVEFVPGCSDVQIKEPSDNWIVNSNSETGDTLYVTLDNYDVNYPNFGYIRLQYRPVSSPSWSTVSTFYPSHLYANAQGAKEDIGTRSAIVYPWKMPSADGAYELRAVAYSVNSSNGTIVGNPLSSYATSALSGYKDVSKPASLGSPAPASGILAAADELSITFNEDIQTGMLTSNNFTISGVLNEQTIAEPNVGLAFDGTGSAYTEAPIYANSSFSIETWFSRTPNTAGTLFAYGANDNYVSLGFDATGKAILKAGGQTLTSVDAVANDETWKYIALAFNRTDNTVTVYEFEGASSKILFNGVSVTAVPEVQGKLYAGSEAAGTNGFRGAVAQLHFYSGTRGQADVSVDKSIAKTGRERGLIGYWNLEEGEGSIAKDKARSRDLNLNTGWYIYPGGRAVTLNGSNYMSVPVSTYPLDVFSDFTLEFWFKGAASQSGKTLFSADNATLGFDAGKQLTLYKVDGTVNQVLSSTDLLDDGWHHFALAVKRNGTTNAYVDGQSTAAFSSDLIGSFASRNYYFGAKRVADNTFSAHFTGNVDEIRIWNSALKQDVIVLNKNSKLTGNEAGLQAYYPFEIYNKQASGLVTVIASKANVVDSSIESGGSASIGTNAVAVKDVRPVEDVPFTYVASSNKIVFTLDENYFSRVEGVTLNITASDIYDMRGNKSNTESWIAYVNRNNLLWDSNAIDKVMAQGKSETFTAKIVNTGGATVSYSVENLPDWLSLSSAAGNLQPLASKELTFTIFQGINIGSYEASIELTGGNGVKEILPVRLKVTGIRPDWAVNPFDFESTMNITGRILIMDVNQEDEEDLLAAFIGETCVGLVSPQYVSEYNAYYTFMNVYGNSAHAGQAITLKLWDASTGNVYTSIDSKLNSTVQNLTFTANGIMGNANAPVVHNALDIIEQSITLGNGWNWISVNVENSNPTLIDQFKTNIGDAGTLLKGQSGYIQTPGWAGTLTSIDTENMYMLNTNTEYTLRVNGKAANPATTQINLTASGWTWIGYTPQFTLPVNNALAGLNPQTGDQIKGHSGYRTYMGANGWIGSLDYMRPGEGYMYYSQNNTAQTLVYPSVSSQYYKAPSALKAVESVEQMNWEANPYQYPNTMTVTAFVEIDEMEVQSAQIEIAAFVGNECRGSVMLQYEDVFTHPYMGFLMVFGENNDAVHFRIYDHQTGKEYIASNPLVAFESDKIYGDPGSPYRIAVITTDVADIWATAPKLYPNPVKNTLWIDYQIEVIDLLEIVDLSGRIVIQQSDFSDKSINVSSLDDGMYLLKLTKSDETFTSKFIKE